MNHTAIYTLYPNVTYISGDTAYDADGNKVNYDADAVKAWVNPNQYKIDRLAEYPSIQELVVALYDEEDKASIVERRNAVKAKYPKPE